MIPRYSMTGYFLEDEYSRKVCLHKDDIFEPGLEVSLKVESQYDTEKWKSFWHRAFRLKPYGSNSLLGQDAVRGENPLWIDDVDFGAKDVKFTFLFISLCCIWHVSLYVVSLFSHLHNEVTDINCSHESSVEIWEILVARVMLIPLFHSLVCILYQS